MIKSRLYRASRFGCGVFALSITGQAALGGAPTTAYFSIEGDINAPGDQYDFFLDLTRSVSSPETLFFETHTDDGGVNQAGDVIPSSSFDSDLRLFDGLNSQIAQADEIADPDFDALLSWASVQTDPDGTPLPDPLPADNYRLNLRQFDNVFVGPFAVDLVGPDDAIVFTGGSPGGTGTADSLKLGSNNGGSATYNHAAGNFTLLGDLVIAQTGSAVLNHTGGNITARGSTDLNAGGTLTQTSGVLSTDVFNLNGGTLDLQGGSWSVNQLNGLTSLTVGAFMNIGDSNAGASAASVSVGAGQSLTVQNTLSVGEFGKAGTLTINSGGNVNAQTNMRLGGFGGTNGSAVNVNAGGTLDVTGTLRVGGSFVGAGGTSTLSVDGVGASAEVDGPLIIFPGSAVNVLNSGTLTANDGITIDDGSLSVVGNDFTHAAGQTLVASNSSQVTFNGFYSLDGGRHYTIQSGSDLIATSSLDIGVGTNGSLLVEGSGSSLQTSGPVNFWGSAGGTGNVTIRNNATATLNNNIAIAGAGVGTSADVSIENGGSVTVNAIDIANDSTDGSGILTVTGNNSVLTQNGASHLGIGQATGGSATVEVASFGVFNTGTGLISIEPTGTINAIFSGIFNAKGDIQINGGTINNDASSFNITPGRSLTATNGAQAGVNDDYSVTGATLSAQSDADASFDDLLIQSDGSAGVSTATVTGTGSSITQNNGAALTVGHATTGSATLNVQDSGFFTASHTGVLTVNATATVNVDTGGVFTAVAPGALSGVNGDPGATLTSAGDWTIDTGTVRLDGEHGFDGDFNGTDGGAGGTFQMNGGTIDLDGASLLSVAGGGGGFENILGGGPAGLGGDGGTVNLAAGTVTLSGTSALSVAGGSGGDQVDGGTFNGQFGGAGGSGGTVNISGASLELLPGTSLLARGGTGGYSAPSAANGSFGGQGGAVNLSSGSVRLNGALMDLDGQSGGSSLGGSARAGASAGTLDVSGGLFTLDGGVVSMDGGHGGDILDINSFSGGGVGGSAGTLTVSGGDVVINDGTLSMIGGDAGSSQANGVDGSPGSGGQIIVSSGSFTLNDGLISIQPGAPGNGLGIPGAPAVSGGLIDVTGGTFTMADGEVFVDTIQHPGTGTFNFTGGTLHAKTFDGSLTQGGGTLAPGLSPGNTHITGDYALNASGTLEIEIAGTTPGTGHDFVTVDGTAQLLGELEVTFINGFTPSAGDQYQYIIAVGGLLEGFNSIILPDISGLDLAWGFENTANFALSLLVNSTLTGDLNNDGFVGIDDLNIVLGAWNQNVPPANPLADPSGDGFVGIDDLNAVLGNWNAGTPPNSSANIPEPATLTLLTLGVVAVSRRRPQ